ncbi:MAG: hypothetical protein CMJ83_01350 [Planctomycetes bacterium]|nr:hypothetical protein [Planctomycetota bacterium]
MEVAASRVCGFTSASFATASVSIAHVAWGVLDCLLPLMATSAFTSLHREEPWLAGPDLPDVRCLLPREPDCERFLAGRIHGVYRAAVSPPARGTGPYLPIICGLHIVDGGRGPRLSFCGYPTCLRCSFQRARRDARTLLGKVKGRQGRWSSVTLTSPYDVAGGLQSVDRLVRRTVRAFCKARESAGTTGRVDAEPRILASRVGLGAAHAHLAVFGDRESGYRVRDRWLSETEREGIECDVSAQIVRPCRTYRQSLDAIAYARKRPRFQIDPELAATVKMPSTITVGCLRGEPNS